jgi:antirestriction protein ArdC
MPSFKVLYALSQKIGAKCVIYDPDTYGAVFHMSTHGHYIPKVDEIHLADRNALVLVHELVHWTGHSSRLARLPVVNGERDILITETQRAQEELIAYRGSLMLAKEIGLDDPMERDFLKFVKKFSAQLGVSDDSLDSQAIEALQYIERVYEKFG